MSYLFGNDIVIGDWKASDYGVILAAFEYEGSSEHDLALNHSTIEEYVGQNPVPIYLGAQYSEKLKPTITLVKDPSNQNDNSTKYFTEHECRFILRELTGFNGYKWMQIDHDSLDELLFYYVRITGVRYQKINQYVYGITLDLECDSPFAWSQEFYYSYSINNNETLIFYNTSDDLYNYLYPIVTISSSTYIPNLTITNIDDNNRSTELTNVAANTIITMDCKNEILSIPGNTYPLNNFNMKWMRLVNGENKFISNANINISFRYRVARKVGFITI